MTFRTQPANWTQQLPQAFASISIGGNGEIWGLQPNDSIWRWNGAAWTQFPGTLSSIAVGGGSNVWGVNRAGQVLKLNAAGTGWEMPNVPPGTFVSVSTSMSDGTVLLRSDGTLWKM